MATQYTQMNQYKLSKEIQFESIKMLGSSINGGGRGVERCKFTVTRMTLHVL